MYIICPKRWRIHASHIVQCYIQRSRSDWQRDVISSTGCPRHRSAWLAYNAVTVGWLLMTRQWAEQAIRIKVWIFHTQLEISTEFLSPIPAVFCNFVKIPASPMYFSILNNFRTDTCYRQFWHHLQKFINQLINPDAGLYRRHGRQARCTAFSHCLHTK